MPKSVELIFARVTEQLRRGSTIDIYRLAEMLQEQCPGLTREDIAKTIAEAVMTRGGSAIWHRRDDASSDTSSDT